MSQLIDQPVRWAHCEGCGRWIRTPLVADKGWCQWCAYEAGDHVEVCYVESWWTPQQVVAGDLLVEYTPGMPVDLRVDGTLVRKVISAECVMSVGPFGREIPDPEDEWR